MKLADVLTRVRGAAMSRLRWRYEPFGATVEWTSPPMLFFLRSSWLRKRGMDHPSWALGRSHLSAPTEVHVQLTNRCSQGCTHCYTDSLPQAPADELSTEGMKAMLDDLARFGVFHLAMGGGESLERDDLFDMAAYARSLDMIPNLTTNGQHVTQENASLFKVFGQVNVSVDGVEGAFGVHRRASAYPASIQALRLLRKTGVRCGINMVVSRGSFENIPDVVRLARRLRLHEVELLRMKPVGRGAKEYGRHALTPEQISRFPTLLTRLARWPRPAIKIDCSLVPFIVADQKPSKSWPFLGMLGCEAGNHLLSTNSAGKVAPCSFLPVLEKTSAQVAKEWLDEPTLQAYRTWTDHPLAPCDTCPALDLCRGGCHAVSLALGGEWRNPDPECPRVRRWREKNR